jgi:hypothetical protein
MNIKIVKLISGEELIGDWDRNKFTISNPVVMIPVSKEQLGFQPWSPLSDDEDIKLKEQHIIAILTPDTKLQNEYSRVYGSGLVMPEDSELIH